MNIQDLAKALVAAEEWVQAGEGVGLSYYADLECSKQDSKLIQEALVFSRALLENPE